MLGVIVIPMQILTVVRYDIYEARLLCPVAGLMLEQKGCTFDKCSGITNMELMPFERK